MKDRCPNGQPGTREAIESGGDEITQIRPENYKGCKPNNARHEYGGKRDLPKGYFQYYRTGTKVTISP